MSESMQLKQIDEKQIDSMWRKIESEGLKLTVIMAGKTGCGKTSLMNAIFKNQVGEVAQDGRPCTKKNEWHIWKSDVGDVSIIDVPGFGEANSPQINGLDYQENIHLLGKSAHLMLLVLKCDDKALQLEENFLNVWNADNRLKKVPVFIIINQIDKMKPVREWNPDTLNLTRPKSAKEISIKSYIDYVADLPAFRQYALLGHIFPACAGESLEDQTYGIDKLRTELKDHVPEMLQMVFIDTQLSIEEKAMNIIKWTSAACAGLALQPIPFLDSLFLAPPQILMITKLAKLHNLSLTKGAIAGIFNTIILSFAGNMIFLNLVKFVPGLGSIFGPAIAYQLTYTAGCVANELFKDRKTGVTEQEAKALACKYEAEAKRLAKDYAD